MDRYEKGVQLGKGTFATVYKGRDKQVSGRACSNLGSIDSSGCLYSSRSRWH
jgi:serine/threonine protein kinase